MDKKDIELLESILLFMELDDKQQIFKRDYILSELANKTNNRLFAIQLVESRESDPELKAALNFLSTINKKHQLRRIINEIKLMSLLE